MKEIKLRIEDALAATRAAVEEGIVAGGGIAFLNTISVLDASIKKAKGDIKTGMKIVLRAIEEPVRQIASNAGVEGSVIVDKIISNEDPTFGYDVSKDSYVDMIKEGIIDPTKVTRSALQNAASIAALLLTTERIVTDIPSEEPPMPAAPGGMPGMY